MVQVAKAGDCELHIWVWNIHTFCASHIQISGGWSTMSSLEVSSPSASSPSYYCCESEKGLSGPHVWYRRQANVLCCINLLERAHLFGSGCKTQIQGVGGVAGVLLACTYVYPCCAQPTFRYLNYNKFSGSVEALGNLTNMARDL